MIVIVLLFLQAVFLPRLYNDVHFLFRTGRALLLLILLSDSGGLDDCSCSSDTVLVHQSICHDPVPLFEWGNGIDYIPDPSAVPPTRFCLMMMRLLLLLLLLRRLLLLSTVPQFTFICLFWLLVVRLLVLILIRSVSTIIYFSIFGNNFKFKLQIIILTQIVWVDSDTGTVVTMFRVQPPPSPTPIPTTLVATIATGPIVYGQSLLMSSTGRALLLLLLLSHASWSRELSVPPEI